MMLRKKLSKIAGWKMCALSQAGRITLIKAVATAIPLYCMSTFSLPKGWCEDIEQLLKDFLWGFPSRKKKNFTPKAWDSICLPKALGGLGVRKMFEINLALIAKLGWQILHKPDSFGSKS